MAPRSFTRSEGLRLSLLALAASASIVGGVFVTAPPAFGDDALPDASAACLVAQGPESMASLSSIVHAGESVHVEGSGWGPGTEQIRGFVIIPSMMVRRSAPMEWNCQLGSRCCSS